MVRRSTPSLKMVGSRLEKVTDLQITTKKGTVRQETVRSKSSRDVGGGQMHASPHKQNFKPAAPISGDEIIKKRRFSPLVACVSVAGWCETDVGGHSIADMK
jgi:hypothetical protein